MAGNFSVSAVSQQIFIMTKKSCSECCTQSHEEIALVLLFS